LNALKPICRGRTHEQPHRAPGGAHSETG
jgi:hypothetical protein